MSNDTENQENNMEPASPLPDAAPEAAPEPQAPPQADVSAPVDQDPEIKEALSHVKALMAVIKNEKTKILGEKIISDLTVFAVRSRTEKDGTSLEK